jgi:hypothetical protein
MTLKLPPPASAGRKRLLNLLAGLALLAGWGSAGWIWWSQDRLDRAQAAQAASGTGYLAPEDSRKYRRDVEIYYGQSGVLLEKWSRWADHWTHGKPLAKLVAASTLLVAGGLFLAGRARAEPQPQETPE